MTVVFQDKLIYLSYMPPFARSECLDDYASFSSPIQWREDYIKSSDGTRLAVCVGEAPDALYSQRTAHTGKTTKVVICYFQGNGGSTPPRLPQLSNALKEIIHRLEQSNAEANVRVQVVALSYRGYWKSSGWASQSGIEMDSQAMLRWIHSHLHVCEPGARIVLWGQSVGAGVAATAAASYLSEGQQQLHAPLAGLILETPFTSIKAMLLALYPQKWLPYRYLWPFLWNHWNSKAALLRIAEHRRKPKILLLTATRDEVVPRIEAAQIEDICRRLSLDFRRRDIIGALHTDATIRREGQEAVAHFIVECLASQPKEYSDGPAGYGIDRDKSISGWQASHPRPGVQRHPSTF